MKRANMLVALLLAATLSGCAVYTPGPVGYAYPPPAPAYIYPAPPPMVVYGGWGGGWGGGGHRHWR